MTRKLQFCLVLVAVLLVTGCIGGEFEGLDGANVEPDLEEANTNESGTEILVSSTNATEEVETYRFEGESRMAMGASFLSMSVSMDAEGAFDRTQGIGRVETDGTSGADFAVFGNRTEFNTTVYTTENRSYTRVVQDGEVTNGGGWSSKANRPQESSTFGYESVEEVYEGVEAELEGVGTVNGVDAYVVSLNVSAEDLLQHGILTMGAHAANGDISEEGSLEDTEEGTEDGIDEDGMETIRAYLWVAKDTREPLRFSYHLLAEESGGNDNGNEEEGVINVGGGMEFYFDIKYTDHGEPVEVDIGEIKG